MLWTLSYRDFDPSKEKQRETLCTVGNGYFATRGATPESSAGGDDTHYPGTYIAGCYNSLESEVDGRKVENESIVNVPNWLPLTFRSGKKGRKDSDWFDPSRVKILDYEQRLDLRLGVLVRKVRFKNNRGQITRLIQTRFASMRYPHLAGLKTTIYAENWSGHLDFITALDGRVENTGVRTYREFNGKNLVPEKQFASKDIMFLSVRTSSSDIRIVEAAKTTVFKDGKEEEGGERSSKKLKVHRKSVVKNGYIGQKFSVPIEQGKQISVVKLVAIYTSMDRAISESGDAAMQTIQNVPSFSELLKSHEISWRALWRRFKIGITSDARASLIVRVHTFHLLQVISPNTVDLDVGVPARGLHGEAYRGHVFWDELFVFPVLNIHMPDLTRSLLMYRYRRLPKARQIAKDNGFKGALYPWESASNGSEVTPTVGINSITHKPVKINTHLQWHVDAAVAYNIWSYFQVSHDLEFLARFGAEMFLEIAKFYGSLATYNKSRGRYEIHEVMGPDEYHDSYPGSKMLGINNNAYTNVMVVWVLVKAIRILETLPLLTRIGLSEKLGLNDEEISRWKDISKKMFVPFQDDGIISEFEGYNDLKEFDWEAYKKKYKNIQNLADILDSEGDSTNNYKVSKQADVLMLFYLFSSEELKELFSRLGYEFNSDTIPKNIEYYSNRTSHGSTLSRIVHSWIFARLDREKSWQIAKDALESDLSDIQGGTTPEGIHLGAMAGTIEIFQRCYTGIVTRDDVLWLNPLMPKEIEKMSFPLFYRGHTFEIDLTPSWLKITSLPGPAPPAKVGHYERVFEIKPGSTRRLLVKKRSRKKKKKVNIAVARLGLGQKRRLRMKSKTASRSEIMI